MAIVQQAVAQMMDAERKKLIKIKSLYQKIKLILPMLKLSYANIQYYASLVDYYSDDTAKMPIFSFYSLDMAILIAGLDGQKFEVETPTLKARRSKKYFRKGKGVVAYTMQR